jgi:hypothetical protein
MSVFSFSKNSHPIFPKLGNGDRVTLFIEATVRNDEGSFLKFEVSKFDVGKVKSKRHPSEVMRDMHVEPVD